MALVHLTDNTFKKEVIGSDLPVLVDFWAPWCGPCKIIGPFVEESAKEFDGKLKVTKINIDENPQIATQYGIMSIPTLMFFKGGKVMDQVVGALSKQDLKKEDPGEFAGQMKRIFIAATKQNDGKTTVSLGLIRNFQLRVTNVGFIKPIGQRYLEEEGLKIDEDSVLIEEVCKIRSGLKDMSPIAVERGFTEKYISLPDRKPIAEQIQRAFKHVSERKDLVIIEGTGHAGVGSVFDHSNATVARLLSSKVIIISSGGIGRPIDEIVLNKALFEKEGVKVLGVIINKVLPEKFDKISKLVRKGLERKGISVLGVIPYEPSLARPTIKQILEEANFELLCGKEHLGNYISRAIVGAMKPIDAIKYIVDDSLLITPGDRDDIISAALDCFRDSNRKKLKISGVVITGGISLEQATVESLKNAGVPVILAKSDTYDVASSVHDLTVKITPQDKAKIETVVKLVKDNVDMDRILKGM